MTTHNRALFLQCRFWPLLLWILSAFASEAHAKETEPLSVDPNVVFQELDKARVPMGAVTRWFRNFLPQWATQTSVFGLERWQWLGVPLLLFICWLASLLLARLTVLVLHRLAQRSATDVDDEIVKRLKGPAKLIWLCLLTYLGIQALALPASIEAGATRVFSISLTLGFFWALATTISTWSSRYLASEHAAERPGGRALVSLSSRLLRIAVFALATLAIFSGLGFSVTSVLAGLGIGGLALALGAQKTLENLFGAFALALDQPFREGDFVKVEDFVGTVEHIGLRSTRIRTLDRTVISVPNSKLADQRLETYAARDRFRLCATLGLTYSTSRAQVVEVRDGLEKVLRVHPKIWHDSVSVRFVQFSASSLDIEVMCWFLAKDFDEFKCIREEILISFMGVVEGAAAEFAFPTRTVHIAPQPSHT